MNKKLGDFFFFRFSNRSTLTATVFYLEIFVE